MNNYSYNRTLINSTHFFFIHRFFIPEYSMMIDTYGVDEGCGGGFGYTFANAFRGVLIFEKSVFFE